LASPFVPRFKSTESELQFLQVSSLPNPNPRLRTEILILDLEVALAVADEDVHDVDRSRPAFAGLIYRRSYDLKFFGFMPYVEKFVVGQRIIGI
jgi:hypothetical protein